MAEELLAVPGSSGRDVSAKESMPPVPAIDSAAAVEPAEVEPAADPAGERSTATAVEQVAAAEPAEMELSVPTVGSAAVVAVAKPAAAVRTVGETLSVLALEPAAVEESAAEVLVVEPAVASAVEPVAATAAVSATVPTVAGRGRPVLADGPVAAPKGCWVMNPGIAPKVIVRRIPSGRRWRLKRPRHGRYKPESPCQSWDPSQRQGGRQRR
jgi:hypothetical protein